ncbi:MAG: tRNA (adenosine(37)-N6)-threonylcarbamoyltransferase complex ATPase subunit type 1 TsaE [Isosphaeraceae bacterium]|nr:MAG: tRNA (adenosine(37)-N6)-threonylcarbamoyltransferase complex ATPase subunit type 1 TsaE [Isosphaeraceae bacterium]
MIVRAAPDGLVIELADEADTERLGHALAGLATSGTVIALVGPLGAGKTRLVRAFAEARGVDPRAISSPTFVLHHVYEGQTSLIHHFDAYRLTGPGEFEAIGGLDQVDDDALCLIEWADRVAEQIPAGAWWIELSPDPADPGSRRARLRLPAATASQLRIGLESPSFG